MKKALATKEYFAQTAEKDGVETGANDFITCPSGFISTDFKIKNEKDRVFKQFSFKRTNCDN